MGLIKKLRKKARREAEDRKALERVGRVAVDARTLIALGARLQRRNARIEWWGRLFCYWGAVIAAGLFLGLVVLVVGEALR